MTDYYTSRPVSDRIATQLRTEVYARGWTGAKVAERLGVTSLWVTRRLSGTTAVTVEDLCTICNVIGAYPVDLVAQVTVDLPPHSPTFGGA